MNKQVRINESVLYDIVDRVLNGESTEKRNFSFIETLDNLLEFHKKLHKGLYNVYGDYSELKKQQNEYINNLFPYNHKIIKESRCKFPKDLLFESEDNYIDDFFGFIRKNFINEYGNQRLTEQQKTQKTQETQKMSVAKQAVIPLAKSLITAFDGAGTNEALAIQTIKKIKSKEEVYQLDKILKSWKKGSLKDYINGDMSDYDSKGYREIWGHLGKFGVTGANYNNFLAGVGKVVDAIGQGWTYLKDKGIGWLMGKFREFLDSGWGSSAQLFLDSFGVGAIGVAAIWGLMFIWDLVNLNVGGWVMPLLSLLSLLTAGAMSPIMGPITKLLKPIKGSFLVLIRKLMKSPLGKSFSKWIPKIASGISKVGEWIGAGVTWLIEKFGKYIPKNWADAIKGAVSKGIAWAKSVVDNLTSYLSKEGSDVSTSTYGDKLKKIGGNVKSDTSDKILTNITQTKLAKKVFPGVETLMANPKWVTTLSKLDKPTAKLVDKYVKENIKKYSWETIEQQVCKTYGQIACKVVDKIGTAFQLKDELVKAQAKGSSALSYRLKPLTKDQMATMTKDEIKKYQQKMGSLGQKAIKDVQKVGKSAVKGVEYGNQELA